MPKFSSFEIAAQVRVTQERATALIQQVARARHAARAKAEQRVIDSERRHTETTLALERAEQNLFRRE